VYCRDMERLCSGDEARPSTAISKSRGVTTDHPGAVVDWQSQTGSDIDQHCAMHHAGLDR
jgi:hypothetical protein